MAVIAVLLGLLFFAPSAAESSGRRRTGAAQGILNAIEMAHEERVAALSQPQVIVVPMQQQVQNLPPATNYIDPNDTEQIAALVSAGAYACPLGGEIFLLTPEEKAYVRSGIKIPCKNHAHISLEPIAVVASQRGYSVPSSTQSGTKFCPTGGELYGADIKYCPNHGVELRWKQ